MTYEEVINTLKIAIAEVEWNYPVEYAVAFEKSIEAVKKQIPEKPMYEPVQCDGDFGGEVFDSPICPTCGWLFEENEIESHHCRCGQALDWSSKNDF